jgi:hypothetical protein
MQHIDVTIDVTKPGRRSACRQVAVIAALSVAAGAGGLGPWMTTAARAAGSAGGVCHESVKVSVTPGLTVTPKPVTFTFSGTMSGCQTPDPSVQWGSANGSGSGTFGCTLGIVSGLFTFVWNNGKTTSGTFSIRGVEKDGMVSDGEFAGSRFVEPAYLQPFDPSPCASDGVTEVRAEGTVIMFGGS